MRFFITLSSILFATMTVANSTNFFFDSCNPDCQPIIEFANRIEVIDDNIFATNHAEIIGADQAHKRNVFGEGVKIAIIDKLFNPDCDLGHTLSQSCISRLTMKRFSEMKQIFGTSADENHCNFTAS